MIENGVITVFGNLRFLFFLKLFVSDSEWV